MDKKLIKAVIRQLGDDAPDMVALGDIATYGANTGWPGFTYYTDTLDFFKRNRAAIVALVKEQAEDLGEDVVSFVASFNCLREDDPHGEFARQTKDEIGRAIYGRLRADDTLVPNALAWFALEEVARYLTDNPESVETEIVEVS